ncbi:CIC11C00000004990 [Sungouiella intermedia]|uniref:CIC11C00000004990 n=1 Tax=Sungouiella intermedia TaxID=45354 RepID=A0A1L0C2U4_9ASCO|nr:CIC11C00000004990 [[Candida] intermedia]
MDLLRPDSGSLFTTTSEFPNNYGSSSAYLPLTTYTTTWTTTNSDGSVETDSGIVIVSTDSAGSLFTTTSEFPNLDYYITTWRH